MAIGLAGLITATEWLARRMLPSRANGWLLAYGAIGCVAVARGARFGPPSGGLSLPGFFLAGAGYPLGRRLFGDRPASPPSDRLAHDLAALLVVAAAEELTWGATVEPVLGPGLTGALFAAKHGVIDHRWRRTPGLFLFWLGLSRQRRRWPAAALALHAGLNALAVLVGHRTWRDQF